MAFLVLGSMVAFCAQCPWLAESFAHTNAEAVAAKATMDTSAIVVSTAIDASAATSSVHLSSRTFGNASGHHKVATVQLTASGVPTVLREVATTAQKKSAAVPANSVMRARTEEKNRSMPASTAEGAPAPAAVAAHQATKQKNSTLAFTEVAAGVKANSTKSNTSSSTSRKDEYAKDEDPEPSTSSGDERFGNKGNPIVWTICVAYGGLTVLAIFAYCVWVDSAQDKLRETRPKPELGLPAGYTRSAPVAARKTIA